MTTYSELRVQTKAEILKYLGEVAHATIVAGINREIWWTYKEKESRAKYVDVMNLYDPFFATSIHAHFIATIFPLYRLYETRHDSYSIPALLRFLKKCPDFPKDVCIDLERLADGMKPLWVKVSNLRNHVFAHRSMKFDVAQTFKNAHVKPRDLKKLIEETENIIDRVYDTLHEARYPFGPSGAAASTLRLLGDLDELRKRR